MATLIYQQAVYLNTLTLLHTCPSYYRDDFALSLEIKYLGAIDNIYIDNANINNILFC